MTLLMVIYIISIGRASTCDNTTPADPTVVVSSFPFQALGIGGLDMQFEQIFRRAFASRVLPPSMVERLGIHHVKGVLLHGPPGTGAPGSLP